MKSKKAASAPRGKNSDTKALLATRERVKVAKKQVKDAKAVLKAARRELKEAKKARNVVEARIEARKAIRPPRRKPPAKVTSDSARATPARKRVAAQRARRSPAIASAESLAGTPAVAGALSADHSAPAAT